MHKTNMSLMKHIKGYWVKMAGFQPQIALCNEGLIHKSYSAWQLKWRLCQEPTHTDWWAVLCLTRQQSQLLFPFNHYRAWFFCLKEEKVYCGVAESFGRQWQVGDVVGVFLDLIDRTISKCCHAATYKISCLLSMWAWTPTSLSRIF